MDTGPGIPEGFDVYEHGGVWFWQSRTVRGHAGEEHTRDAAVLRAWDDKHTEDDARRLAELER